MVLFYNVVPKLTFLKQYHFLTG